MMLRYPVICTIVIILIFQLIYIGNHEIDVLGAYVKAEPKEDGPQLLDPLLKVDRIVDGLESATSMAFLKENDILVLEKSEGRVMRVLNGELLEEPVLQVSVGQAVEWGMLGIEINRNSNPVTVFLYYTENIDNPVSTNGIDVGTDVANSIYSYEFVDGKLVNPKLLLRLPAFSPGTQHLNNHVGGKLLIGPDSYLYITIGDVGGRQGQAQNIDDGSSLDGTSGILRITQTGDFVPIKNFLVFPDDEAADDEAADDEAADDEAADDEAADDEAADDEAADDEAADDEAADDEAADAGISPNRNLYYAFGIRNSFGFDFDPVTGMLWDTENGPDENDEINVVREGFNSGWNQVQGFADDDFDVNDLIQFENSYYEDPQFVWQFPVGVTELEFLSSSNLGSQYENTMFVGDVNTGNLYNFRLNEARNGLLLAGDLSDHIANSIDEIQSIIFGSGFGVITDIKDGLDGSLYILNLTGEIYKIYR